MATSKKPTTSGYLPDDYEQPSGVGGFTEIKDGDNHLRILSKPLLVWTVWENGKVRRYKFTGKDSKPAKPTTTEKDSVKHAWIVIVWNHDTVQIEIWEITQAGIISDIIALVENAKWGLPHEYDLCVTRSGSGLKTEYKTVPEPKSEIPDEAMSAFESTPIDLEEMLKEDGKPFLSGGGNSSGAAADTKPAKAEKKIVTPENWAPGDEVPVNYKLSDDGKKITKKKTPF